MIGGILVLRPIMIQLEFTLALPDGLAQEARAAGLLTSEAIEALIRDAVRRQHAERFFEDANRLAALDLPPLTEEEIEAEIQMARQERRRPNASGS